jgi:hypothetical protein
MFENRKCTKCGEDKNMYGGCKCNGYTTAFNEENKCLTCELWEPHIDDKSPKECQEEVEKGNLKIEKDNCSKWLCNNGTCPNYNLESELLKERQNHKKFTCVKK